LGCVIARSGVIVAQVFVVFWFDCEDFVTPESDDALKRLAEILRSNGVRGVFKLVGEKLRSLERRGRWDVIEALKNHEIGFHTNYHSVHPTVAEYLKDMGLEEGMLEFEKREGSGVKDIERVFGVKPSCYGQPGGAWAPQVYPALKKMGIPVYLDATEFIDLDGRPFWYCGVLNILSLRGSKGGVISLNFELGTPGFIEKAMREFDEVYTRIVEGGEWGIISVYNHPCTLVTTEFWDAVNFSKGKNTPFDAVKKPKLKPRNWVEAGYRDFEAFVKHAKSKPHVRFVTAMDLYRIFMDEALDRVFSIDEVTRLASDLKTISFKKVDGLYVSASEVFWLVTAALADYRVHGVLPSKVRNMQPLGPYRSVNSERLVAVKLNELLDAACRARSFIETNGRIPDYVEVAGLKVNPADFLASEAKALLKLHRGEVPEWVELVRAVFEPSKYVSSRGAKGSWRWIVFPDGFEAWNLVEVARLQTWTLKPAEPSPVSL